MYQSREIPVSGPTAVRTTDTDSIRVLIADDHAIVRKGIRALLATERDIQVVGEARDGQEAIAESERLQPDVVLMDLVMPVVSGVEATRHIVVHLPIAGPAAADQDGIGIHPRHTSSSAQAV